MREQVFAASGEEKGNGTERSEHLFIAAFMLIAYVVLDGFDLGAGIINLFVASNYDEHRLNRNTRPWHTRGSARCAHGSPGRDDDLRRACGYGK